MKDLLKHSIKEHAACLEKGEYTATELVEACLSQIDLRDGVVGAFLHVDAEGALKAAKDSDDRRAKGQALGPMDGIPYALKDNISAKGLPMTCASRMLKDYIAPYDATVTERMRGAGAVLIGKNNMDEFAMGSSTEYSALGVTTNPHDPARVPGGSSGGSAAAVASHEVPVSIGTDTGGSVRQPAAFCGVYGFKPTYGTISRYGVATMASSLDTVGLLSRTVEDCATAFEALAGRDVRDASSKDYPTDAMREQMTLSMKDRRIAIVNAFSTPERMEDAVFGALQNATCLLREAGARIESVNLPLPEEALATYSVISCAEASSNLARYDGVHFGRRSEAFDNLTSLYDNSRAEGFGEEVKRRILFGTDMLLEGNRAFYYVRAQRVREMVKREMTSLSRQYDLLLTPTTPTVAFSRGSRPSPETLYNADLCTVFANLSGFPALSIPFGEDEKGLPLAVQLTARPFEEGLLFAAARLFEEVTR